MIEYNKDMWKHDRNHPKVTMVVLKYPMMWKGAPQGRELIILDLSPSEGLQTFRE